MLNWHPTLFVKPEEQKKNKTRIPHVAFEAFFFSSLRLFRSLQDAPGFYKSRELWENILHGDPGVRSLPISR